MTTQESDSAVNRRLTMKPVTRNLIANYVGRGWLIAINLIATPLIIKLLGIESYGLIGFYTTLYGVINLLDFGISPTINRELAKYSVDETQRGRGRDLVRTLEIGYWIIGILLGIVVYFGAPLIARNWLQSTNIPTEALLHSIRLMGFLVVLEWPITFYQGALLGLQRHVRLNVINITNGLLKYGGALVILTFFSPTIDAFFSWQILISTIVMAFLVFTVWRSLPVSENKPVFDIQLLEKIWKFALSMNLISFLALVIQQMDKVLVSHFFTLEIFGYYNLATMVTSGFTMLFSPINMTYFPRLSVLFSQKDETSLRHEYHQACQLIAVAVLPAVTTGILFSNLMIRIWTGNQSIAEKTAPIAAMLLMGTALKALVIIPFSAQVSHGWTKLSLITNIISLPIIFILFFMLNSSFGILGVASIWVIYNLMVLIITIPIMHRKILHGEYGNWLKEDTAIPLAVCLLLLGAGMVLEKAGTGFQNSIFALLSFAIVIEACVALIVPFTRGKIMYYFDKYTNRYLKRS